MAALIGQPISVILIPVPAVGARDGVDLRLAPAGVCRHDDRVRTASPRPGVSFGTDSAHKPLNSLLSGFGFSGIRRSATWRRGTPSLT